MNPVEADERLGLDVVIHVRDSRLAAFEVLGVGQGLVVSLHPVGLRSELGEQPFRRCWHVPGIAAGLRTESRRGAISARSLFGQPLGIPAEPSLLWRRVRESAAVPPVASETAAPASARPAAAAANRPRPYRSAATAAPTAKPSPAAKLENGAADICAAQSPWTQGQKDLPKPFLLQASADLVTLQPSSKSPARQF